MASRQLPRLWQGPHPKNLPGASPYPKPGLCPLRNASSHCSGRPHRSPALWSFSPALRPQVGDVICLLLLSVPLGHLFENILKSSKKKTKKARYRVGLVSIIIFFRSYILPRFSTAFATLNAISRHAILLTPAVPMGSGKTPDAIIAPLAHRSFFIKSVGPMIVQLKPRTSPAARVACSAYSVMTLTSTWGARHVRRTVFAKSGEKKLSQAER